MASSVSEWLPQLLQVSSNSTHFWLKIKLYHFPTQGSVKLLLKIQRLLWNNPFCVIIQTSDNSNPSLTKSYRPILPGVTVPQGLTKFSLWFCLHPFSSHFFFQVEEHVLLKEIICFPCGKAVTKKILSKCTHPSLSCFQGRQIDMNAYIYI